MQFGKTGRILEDLLWGAQNLLCVRWLVTVFFQVLFQVAPFDLDRSAQLHARDLSASQVPVDPTLAHPQLLAQLRYRDEVQALPLLRAPLSLPTNGFLEF